MTKPDKYQSLLDTVGEADKADLILVQTARTQAMQAYQTKPGKDTRADLVAAREEYDDTVARLHTVYFPEEAPTAEGERFKNRKQALNWLQAQGYKVSTGKFYQDCDAGFPGVHKDGTLSRFQVMQYGQQLDVEKRCNPANYNDEQVQLELRKLRAETERKERENEDSLREFDKKWLHRDAAEESLAALIGALSDAQDHQIYTGSPGIIQIAGGDPSRVEEVAAGIRALVSTAFTEVLTEGKIEGIFEGEPEDEEE